MGIHGIEGTLHFLEFCSKFGDHIEVSCVSSDETSKIPLFRRASQAAISFCFCFFYGFGHSSGQIASSRLVSGTSVGRPLSHLDLSGSFILHFWKRVVPIYPSESNIFSVVFPGVVQRGVGGVIDACS